MDKRIQPRSGKRTYDKRPIAQIPALQEMVDTVSRHHQQFHILLIGKPVLLTEREPSSGHGPIPTLQLIHAEYSS